MVEHLTTKEFQEKIFDYTAGSDWSYRGDNPAIIDFYADWCGPCKMFAPIMDELAQNYRGKVDFYKVNTEQEMELSAAFGIQSIPSILFIPNGKDDKPQINVGALPKENMIQAISEVLGVEPVSV